MFVIWALLVRYPRMYSTPPPPETEEEEAEDDTIVQLLQLPDAITFLSLVALSITLPLKMDGHLEGWTWNRTLFPLYFSFFAPLLALLILIPLIGWRPIRYGMIKPFSTWGWWMDFVTYTVAGPVWVYLLTLHLDGKTDAERLPWKEVWIPLLLINAVSVLTNIVFFNLLELVKDLAFSLPFNIFVFFKLSEKTKLDSWWHVMSAVFAATALLPLYMTCLPNPRTSRLLIFCGSIAVTIPLLMFQIQATQKLAWEDANDQKSDKHWPWKAIFGPVYAVEGMMMCPICYAIMCTVGYNIRRERKRRQLEEKEREAAAGGEQSSLLGGGGGGSQGFEARFQGIAAGFQPAQENAVERAERGMSTAVGKVAGYAAPQDRLSQQVTKRAASHAVSNVSSNVQDSIRKNSKMP